MDHTSRLPAEIIRNLLVCARRANPIPNAIKGGLMVVGTSAQQLVHALAWVSMTHVCSRWRSIALRDASLWTDIPVVLGLDWLKTFVARASSGPGPIRIDWQSLRYHDEDSLILTWIQDDLIPAHYRIMSNLVIKLRRHMEPELLSTLNRSWPMLEVFTMTYHYNKNDRDTILDHNFPRLRSLNWSGAHSSTFPWQAPCIHGLTCLSLSFMPGISGADMAEFLDTLGRMRNLKDLRINNGCWDSLAAGTVACSACAPAVRTQNIDLDVLLWLADVAVMSHIMQHIALPPQAKLWLDVQSVTSHARTGEHIRSICSQAYAWSQRAPTSPPYLSAQITEHPHHLLQMRFSRSPVFPISRTHSVLDWDRAADDTDVDFALNTWLSRDGEYPSTLQNVLQELAPQGIRAVHIHADKPASLTTLVTTLSDPVFQNVVCLQLPSDRAYEYLSCLITVSKNDRVVVPLPNLKLLAFGDTSSSSLVHPLHIGGAAGLLDSFLSVRRKAGSPLQAIYISKPKDMHDVVALYGVIDARDGDDATSKTGTSEGARTSNGVAGFAYTQDVWKIPVQPHEVEMMEDRFKKVGEAIATLNATPEVLFIPSEEDALHKQNLWNILVG